jgi:hypothetical protein
VYFVRQSDLTTVSLIEMKQAPKRMRLSQKQMGLSVKSKKTRNKFSIIFQL